MDKTRSLQEEIKLNPGITFQMVNTKFLNYYDKQDEIYYTIVEVNPNKLFNLKHSQTFSNKPSKIRNMEVEIVSNHTG